MSYLMRPHNFVPEWSIEPKGDQPQAIKELIDGLNNNKKHQVLLGVTGSGKTFTMANIIAKYERPTLILAHNKTLAAQLFQEFKELFPHNAVEYYVSYYDYYQPEVYIPNSDTFIDKEATNNDDIDKMRHRATRSLLERRDVIVVASVSCIYGLGNPKLYLESRILIFEKLILERDDFLRKLISIQYKRNDISFERGTFRVRGDVVDVIPAYEKDLAIRVRFLGKIIEKIQIIDSLRGTVQEQVEKISIYPASHYIANSDLIEKIICEMKIDLDKECYKFIEQNKLVEAQRLSQRTMHDIDMLKEIGSCQGIENYSRYIDGRNIGEAPSTLIDYFPQDFLMFIDESHVSIPQTGAMYKGDRSRKENLVNYGFRLSAAYDNRPLNFDEFNQKINQIIYVSATPAEYELKVSNYEFTEQVIRPTGLVDPKIEVYPASNQIDDLYVEILKVINNNSRVLVTTLTKKMSEEITKYYKNLGLKIKYLHSEIDSIERVEILRNLRLGTFDVLVGINLLREGLDLPEVELVAILDADKEGFLRSKSSLIQTVGRAARNVNGRVIFYADKITYSMQACIEETERRREKQINYNEKNNINPTTIIKKIPEGMRKLYNLDYGDEHRDKMESAINNFKINDKIKTPIQVDKEIDKLLKQMKKAAQKLDFETAAVLRDQINILKDQKLLLENV